MFVTRKPKKPEDFVGKLDIDTQYLQEEVKKQEEEIMILSCKLKEQESKPFALELWSLKG